jgi:aminoglycoside N3'-acetyltransferase
VNAKELTADLAALGVQPGRDLLIHSSLRRVGDVDGGAASVLAALRAAASTHATLVVPAQTTWNSLTSQAFRDATAGLSPAETERYIATIPGFDPATTPSRAMGRLAEQVRTAPDAVRSAHPQSSFAAIGPSAKDCMTGHKMNCHFGEQSPLGWLYRADAEVLLLGVGYNACTAFHLAEYRLPGELRYQKYHCFTSVQGVREPHTFTDIELDDGDFGVLGESIDGESFVRHGRVGRADCRLFPIRSAIDFAVNWSPFVCRRQSARGALSRAGTA